jgi:hypothetical protein
MLRVDSLAGMSVTAPCAGCHGVDSADYLIAAINAYKERQQQA